LTEQIQSDERRSYGRVPAHVSVRPVSILARAVPRRVNDMSLGGLRCYCDEEYRQGKRLELELFFLDGRSAVVLVEVVWTEALPAGAPARFDIGMRYLDCSADSLALIRQAIQPAAD
jgi:hypothetical protein